MKMRLRWAGTLLLDAEKRFRKVQHSELSTDPNSSAVSEPELFRSPGINQFMQALLVGW
jgi:hypothetical protein